MAEESFQEKTEEASPRRLQEAREEGNVPKSAEFNSALILIFGLMTLNILSVQIFQKLFHGFKIFYSELNTFAISIDSVKFYTFLGVQSIVDLIGPFLVVIALVGIVSNVAQVGFLFTLKPLEPKFSKINPIKGLSKFFKLKSFVELVKGLLKLTIIGIIAYNTLIDHQDDYPLLLYYTPSQIISFIATVMFELAMRTLGALLILAFLDLMYQRWQYKRDMRMSKQDIKDESKQAEGNPEVKGAIRAMQQKRARERMMDKVPEADVVITNPTRLAVALQYDPANMDAPIVLAKGARLIAKKIKEIAAEHGVPIYENKPLARSLYKLADVGKAIPFELFHVVAEVFAYVHQLKNRRN